MENTKRAAGLKESAEHIEHVLQIVRTELGKTEKDTDWQGLSRHFASGAEETKRLAEELAASQEADHEYSLLTLFMLRQIEISISFIANLSEQIAFLHNRMEQFEKDVVAMRDTLHR